ncbi:MarR family winged helix-turn-helix transcriptional regulator [Paenibacillus apiarius]|uniref:MarR family transcriptional regulator n=2 Tax=Paenibacillus apiarius TaxID=46240 RepID=A0ABT4DV04_9BACL|nr:MarR family transcriptional regulator [Paenibacillus apiarius]MCY9514304.1 MarR family transcriptional regulator [Paenibacillus apiarius]MCY9520113.1 MarR family transcriptional regulator [Paenibacillus apiarius]MCY9550120.1 MarR family transcriptional regulator [Paenibacillus apiarius]MCY9560269.1 MarR family transcriptional regulator [Paenibacillus apiarius]MCY9683167.1 MarR family transcriptional regulator [Paenibacillus apiarius]
MEDTYLDSIEVLLSQVVRAYNYQMMRMVQDAGIHPGQMPLLLLLHEQDGRSQKELVDKMKVKPATITVMLNRMEKSGLIERRADSVDMRVSRVYLQPQGKAVIGHVEQVVHQIEEQCFAGFREEEKVLLRRFLQHMHHNLSAAGASNG